MIIELARAIAAAVAAQLAAPVPIPNPLALLEVPSPCGFAHRRLVRVADGKQLKRALADAAPGDLVLLADGVYAGKFKAAASGTAEAPIVVCGSRAAALEVGSHESGYGLHVTGDHWIFAGFTVRRAKKGIVLDGASHNLLVGLEVADIGNEGIHFRAFSTDNVLRGSRVHHTGRAGDPRFGEGVYVGSARNHWCNHSHCLPDASDRNLILDNTIGPETTAESVDVKEGTSGGVLRGNLFLGAGMTAADSWVDVKGNDWLVERNRGLGSPRDGFQVYEKMPGWGRGNRFLGNLAEVVGPGYAVRIEGGGANFVACDNQARAARKGLANVRCE
jgi:hypothetical protein